MLNWRYTEEVHKFYSSLNTFEVIKSRGMKLDVYAACMGKNRNAYRIFVKLLARKRQFGRQLE